MTLSTRFIPLALVALALAALPFAAFAQGGNALSVYIDADGKTLVRGAEVTAVSESSLVAETSWGDTVLSWVVKTDGDTSYLTEDKGSFDMDDVDEGDRVSFSGDLDQDASGLTVIANVIKNWSFAAQSSGRVALSGTVEDIDEDDEEFTLSGTRFGDVRVLVDSDTDWRAGSDDDVDFGDLELDMRIAVSGIYDEDDDTLDASVVTLEPKLSHGWNAPLKGWFKGNGWAFGLWKHSKHEDNEDED